MRKANITGLFIFLLAGAAFAGEPVPDPIPSIPHVSSNTTETFAPLAQAASGAALDKISSRLGQVKSFEASFTQDHHLAMFLDVLKARGRCCFAAPDRFRWEMTAPYRSILLLNRDRVAKFEERDGAMRYVESGAYDVIRGLLGQMTGWMRGDFKNQDAFTLAIAEGAVHWRLELTPRDAGMRQYVQAIQVYIRKNPVQTARIVIREPEQDFIEIRFASVRENASLDDRLFDVQNPLTVPLPHDEQ